MALKRCIWFVLLTVASGFAQSYKTCDVTMWANDTQSQTAGITRDNVFYFIRIGNLNYEIERPGPNVEMNSGQRIHCRIEKGYMFIRDSKGQVNKAQIVEAGQPIHNQY